MTMRYTVKLTAEFSRWIRGSKDALTGPGWRMYYVLRGQTLVVMLGGGQKSSQQADIRRVIALAKSLED